MDDFRKIIKFGKSSFVISLPNAWIKKNKLNKGDTISLAENLNSELILSLKPGDKDDEKTSKLILVDGKDISRVKREIIASYLNNYNTITLKGKDMDKYNSIIRQTVQNLMAMEIIEENYETIVAKDFISLDEVIIEEMIRKIDNITRSMIEDIPQILNKDISKNIVQRDDQVNRMTFLVIRAMKQTLRHPQLTNKKNRMSLTKIIDLWEVIFHIEKIADFLKRIARNMSRVKQKKDILKDILVLYGKIKEFYWDTMKAYYNQDDKIALELSGHKRSLSDECNKLHEKYWRIRYLPIIIEDCKNVISAVHNIGRRTYS